MDAAISQTQMELQTASQFRGKRVHFIGVGGCGMSGLAQMLLDAGAIVSGSEPKPNPQTFELTRRGAKISRDQMGELLCRDVDWVVRTAAVPDNNREFIAARALGLQTVKYAQMLGMIMGERFGVAVAGTHGKSTTSAMISYALLQCGADPSFVIGGTVPQLGGGSRSGAGTAFIAEACEFDRSFHNLHPRVAIITNIEEDHLDCYKDIDEIVASFRKFAQLLPADGLIIAGGNDPRVIQALGGITTRTELVALSEGFTWTTRICGIDKGCHVGEVSYKGTALGMLRLSVAGEHNLLNATMAVAAAVACGVDANAAIEALNGFRGVDRRMTVVGKFHGATIVDDYGHHPTEIRATLKALREQYSPKRLLCVFQPHQHSRTRFLLEDFAASFALADETIVPDIYFVRDSEAERQSVSAADLVQRVETHGQRAVHLPKFASIVEYLKSTAREGDLIVTMGAGNVWEIGRDLTAC
ncbi:MAG: UDP-N-acetylmuramate--L-alanine ligase [Planctomycetota bacterium]|nr:UDP-N-acetylmuramate--L-alanine ligase [Planctomycetota bacterium]